MAHTERTGHAGNVAGTGKGVSRPAAGPAVPVHASRTTFRVKQVDAFTETPLLGNPAGVVADARGLTEGQMQAIAREMALSETAFVLPASSQAADLRLRWFTPTAEVSLCGHATIASFHALAEEGMFGMTEPGLYAFLVETRSGILPVSVEKTRSGVDILFGLPLPEFVRAGQFKLDMMRMLNVQLEDFEPRLPIVTSGYLYAPVRRLHTLFALRPNLRAMAQFLVNRSLEGVCVFTTETVDRTSAVHSRFFAPSLGIDEDPVTGSANGPLGVYLFERGLLEPTGDSIAVVGEQGDAIGRPGRVKIRIGVEGTRVASLHIGGRAVTVIDGEMQIA